MFPIQIAGLALAGRTLLIKYGGTSVKPALPEKSRKKYTLALPKIASFPPALPQLPNPLEVIRDVAEAVPARLNTLTNNISGAVEQVKKSIVREDYDKAIKSYIPADAKLIRPQYPLKSQNGHLADIDGDSANELVASYKLKNELRTIVLKKQQDKWVKVSELTIPDYEEINFRGFADITGSGKKQLLLGLMSGSKKPVLRGYSFDNGTAKELFSKNYHRLEVLPERPAQKSAARLALWNKDGDSHKIEVLQWNGTGLEPLKDTSRYFLKRVVPYYVSNINAAPTSPVNWYNLAYALKNAGIRQDALSAADVGFKLAKDTSYKEKLAMLKDEIEGKVIPAPKVEPPAPPEAPVVKQSYMQPGIKRPPYPRY